MLARHLKRDHTEFFITAYKRERCSIIFMTDINCLHICLRIETVRYNFFLAEIWHDIQQRRLIETENNEPVERHFVRELYKRALDVF